MAIVSMKQLLEAGVHFGHQTRRWNPKMKSYIFTERNGIYILDLQKTLELLEVAYDFVLETARSGRQVLFVGTKKQAQESIKEQATRAGMPYVSLRWLGGALTNFATMRTRIGRLKQLEQMKEEGTWGHLPKKEVLKLEAERAKLARNLEGIRDLDGLPGAVYIVDPRKERIAVLEAMRLEIPIVAIVDTNCDPDEVSYVIPGNDDAIRAVTLITRVMADAALQGRELWQAEQAQLAVEEADKAKAAVAEPVLVAPAARAEAETGGKAKVEASEKGRTKAKAEAKPEPEAKPEAKPETKLEAEVESEPEPKAESDAAPAAGPRQAEEETVADVG